MMMTIASFHRESDDALVLSDAEAAAAAAVVVDDDVDDGDGLVVQSDR